VASIRVGGATPNLNEKKQFHIAAHSCSKPKNRFFWSSCATLEKAGYAVETIANADCAEARFKETMPDLLMLEWMLPPSCAPLHRGRARVEQMCRSLSLP
jgi:hypothetical protein